MSLTPLLRALLALVLVAACSRASADEYDTLRTKWRSLLTGSGYDVADPDVASKLTSIASSANSVWSSMDKTATRTYLWSDLASKTDSSDVTSNYSRLRSMALAYATPGCSLQGNAALMADIASALDWLNTNRYNATSAQYGNWWDWEIGTPLQLTDICTLVYDGLTATQRTNYMNAVDHQTPTPDMTGANKIWKARIVGVRGCIVKSTTKLALARDAFSPVFPYVTSGDGFYLDGSFIQHNKHPYTGGYGASLLGTMAPVLNWLSGSTWAVTDPAQANLYKWVFDSYEPLIYRGAVWDFVRGREISRSSSSPQGVGQSFMDSILQIAQFAPPADAARMKSMLKGIAQSDTVRNFVTSRGLPTLGMARQLMADATVAPRGELIGHYHFGSMDRVVHLGEGFGFGLSMCSSRIYNFESINGENLHGWFTGDGMTYLYNTDLVQYAGGFWATVDPYRLPGVTADPTHNKLPANPGTVGSSAKTSNNVSIYNWTGGATLGKYGAAGMQLDGAGVTLTAKKSWFMFDDEIVCLGAGITSTDSRPIETTIENRRLNSSGSNAFTVNGTVKTSVPGWNESITGVNWAHLAGNVPGSDIGYYFPQAATVRGVREARTGAWSDVDEGASTTTLTNNFLRLTFEHGSNPTNAAYQYVLLPGRTARRVGQYAAQPQVAVLANTGNVQAVTESTLGITAANFWTDTSQTAGPITVNKKSSVLVRNDGGFIDISVSDPTQANTGTISVQVALRGGTLVSADPGITVVQSSPTISLTVNVNTAQGKTFTARFFPGTPQVLSIAPEADSFVRDGTPDTNFGANTTLSVKTATGGVTRQAFLRFNVPTLSGVLLNASLKLTPVTSQVPGVHGLVKVDDNSWVESGAGGITWNNKPAASPTLLATWTPALGTPVVADVTTSIASGTRSSFQVYATTQTTDGYVDYASRENATAANRPALILNVGHTPPQIAITSPADGDYIVRAGALTLTADAQATDGAITKVAFYDGATLLGTATAPPYSISANLGGGPHSLSAVATDANGLTRTSFVRRIDVAYPPTAAALATSTPQGSAIEVDLLTLCSDVETPSSRLLFTLGTVSNGTAALLADGHTVRFTPASNYNGPASFGYTVTDSTSDPRTLLNYDFQSAGAPDVTGQGRDGTINVQGTGATATYTLDVPAALTRLQTQSLLLTKNGTAGAARVERSVQGPELDWQADDWTIAGWFKRSSTSAIDSVLQLGDSGGWGSNAMSLVLPGGSTSVELRNYNGATQDVGITKTGIAAGTWYHYAVVRAAGTLSLYINGALAGSDNAFAFSFDNSRPLKFGGVGATTVLDRWFGGSLADHAVFAGALSATEVARLATMPVAYLAGQSAANTVSVNVVSPLDQWRQTNFGTMANTGNAADMADPNKDGIVNLLEFLMGRDPKAQNPASTRPTTVRNGANIEYTYSRTTTALGQFTPVVEWTDNLAAGPWSSAGVSEVILSTTGSVQKVKAIVPMGGNGRRFVRLRVQP